MSHARDYTTRTQCPGKLYRAITSLILGSFLMLVFACMSLGSGGTDSAAAVYLRTLAVPSQYGAIQLAVNATSDGDTVLVSDGTYYESNIDFYGKDITLKSVNGAAATIIDGGGSGPVLSFWTTGTDSTVDGFTIRNGHADHGGAIKVNLSRPVIRNCVIEDNTASWNGGAIYTSGDTTVLTIENTTFRNNHGKGGAIHMSGAGSDLDVSASTFEYNYSDYEGGALLLPSDADVTISGSTFTGNNGTRAGAVICGSRCDMDVSASVFNHNTARSWEGGAIYINSSSEVSVSGSNFNGNSGSKGGAVFTNAATLTLTDVSLAGNQATAYEGGALFIASGADVTIDRTIISGSSGTRGGGIFSGAATLGLTNVTVSGNRATTYEGGGIYASGADLTLTNCTIAGNYAANTSYNGKGGGLYATSGSSRIENSILWGNQSASNILKNQIDGNAAVVVYSDVDQDGYAGSDGNIRQDPLFVSPLPHASAPATGGDYHLQAGSLCENAASAEYSPGIDIDGDSRPQAGAFDMGSDEVLSACSGEQPNLALRTDDVYWASFTDYLNRNLSIDFSLHNEGGGSAYLVQVNHALATYDALCFKPMPVSLGTIADGAAQQFTLYYQVPVGISSFQTTIYVTAEDTCGYVYDYPEPYPGT